MNVADAPTPKSKWRERKPSFIAADPKHEIFRVMAVVDGYVMARRTGCMPFIVPLKQWHGHFVTAGHPPAGGQ